MQFISYYKNTLKLLAANKMRSVLTMLGIVIGIAGVIMVISIGAGAQSLVLNQIKSMGTNLVSILPGGSEEEGPPAAVMGIVIKTLTLEDAYSLENSARAPHIESVSANVTGVDTALWRGNKMNVTFSGVSSAYIENQDLKIALGRSFTREDEVANARVAVLGSAVYDELFAGSEAIGETIKLKKESFRIIGVLEEKGVSGFTNRDKQIYVPVTTAQNVLLGINYVSSIGIKVDTDTNVNSTMEDITSILRDRHDIPGDKDDFTIQSAQQGLDALTSVTDALTYFLAAIAGLSLLVGGIGIMNIMLIAVNERIKEVGLRKSIGATNSDIMYQFLAEAVFITVLGGIVGIILGSAVSTLVSIVANYLGYSWDLVISVWSIVMSSGVCILIGVVFGVYPARKAAKLDPIEALRYE